ncbi:FMN reductase (NADPH) [Tepidimicrobium xylanilyticum]|uniref:FMN reductase (NADPH) n=2 Tax=Tepidimicrobium xylanilyticum TaxID=1123352 RepID=A0A1H2Q9R4_9FIRM|nr:FMN reductase (NADPH) [Tepidimicrobium xylanilyticum]
MGILNLGIMKLCKNFAKELITISNTTIELLKNHVSIRKFKDKDIDKNMIDTIIECAQMAPTSNNLQTYTIIEVRDKKKKEDLSKIAGNQPWVAEAPVVLLFCADLHRSKKYIQVDDPGIFSNAELYTVAVMDTALATQKALIAAQSLGLGGVIVGGIRNDMKAVHDMFKLPNLVAPLFLLCLGYPDQSPELKPRLPKDIIHKIDYYDEHKDSKLIEEYDEIMKEYYSKRSSNQVRESWTTSCEKAFSKSSRNSTGIFLRSIGFLNR